MSEFQKVGNQELLRKNWDAIFNKDTCTTPSPAPTADPEAYLDPNEVLRKCYEQAVDAGVPI